MIAVLMTMVVMLMETRMVTVTIDLMMMSLEGVGRVAPSPQVTAVLGQQV